MTISFDTLPVISMRDVRSRSRPEPVDRRTFLRRVSAGIGAMAFAYITLWDTRRAGAADDGLYYKEWTGTTSGPCGPGRYARNHTENGLKCGPSYASSSYCWTGPTSVWGEAYANTGNKLGWHKWGSGSDLYSYYLQRPDQCWAGSPSDYDSWRWTFSDGVTYGCSDGWVCHIYVGCYMKSICPYPRS